MNIKVIGKRVCVKKERIDVGGLTLQPETEKDGMSNTGVVLSVGQIGLMARLNGVRKGAKISFRKHFVTDHNTDKERTFVYLEDILSVEKL